MPKKSSVNQAKKGSKNVERGRRKRAAWEAANGGKSLRVHRVLIAMANHLRNARRSCGLAFAENLEHEYHRRMASGDYKRTKVVRRRHA